MSKGEWDNIFKIRLKILINEAKINGKVKRSKDVSAAINVSVTAFQNYLSGVMGPSVEKLIALAKFFGVSTDYLLGLSDRRTTGGTFGIGEAVEVIMRNCTNPEDVANAFMKWSEGVK